MLGKLFGETTLIAGLLVLVACGADESVPRSPHGAAGITAIPAGAAGMIGVPPATAGTTPLPPTTNTTSLAGSVAPPIGNVAGRGAPPVTSAGAAAPPTAGMPLGAGGMSAGGSGMGGASVGIAGVGGAAGSAGAPAGGGGAQMTCTGKPGAKNQTIRSSAGPSYIVHVPQKVDPNKAVPLVIFPHGWTMSGALMQALSRFDTVADTEGLIVVYPDGHGANPWNVGDGTCLPGAAVNNPTANTFEYFKEIAKTVGESTCINPKQIFVTGFSMGGYMSNNIGCKLGNEFVRAVGPHSGGTYSGTCPGAPLPIFIMHGASDTFISYSSCGQGARDLWLRRNKCQSDFETKQVPGGTCDWYKGCDPNGQTVFCSWRGVGHSWNGLDASKAVWEFFKAYL